MGLSTIWEGVLAARILDRLGAGVRSAPRDAIVASSVDQRHRGGGFGLEGVVEHAGACFGNQEPACVRRARTKAIPPRRAAPRETQAAKERRRSQDPRRTEHVLRHRLETGSDSEPWATAE